MTNKKTTPKTTGTNKQEGLLCYSLNFLADSLELLKQDEENRPVIAIATKAKEIFINDLATLIDDLTMTSISMEKYFKARRPQLKRRAAK